MNILFVKDACDDYLYWQRTDKNKLKRINELIKVCLREPYSGIGKPEALKFDMAGYWSRRIDAEHRLVYKVESHNIVIVQCRYHY
jgi:toxin YoeB